MRLLIAIVVWIAALAGAAEVSSVVAQSIHTKTASAAASGAGSAGASTGASGGTSSAAPFDASSVTSTDSLSLFRAANLGRALAAARAHLGPGAQVDMLALYPGYLVLTAVKSGSEIDVYINAQDSYQPTNTGGSPGSSALFPLARVKADVPAALAGRIAASGHVPESQLNYMVAEVDPSDNKFRWLVYPKHGNRVEYFQGSGATGPLLEYLSNSSTGLQPVRG